jgi:CRISPR-associated endonuclease/helicase Cas3
MSGELYAHSRNPAGKRDPWEDHLQRVAECAAVFATPFGLEALVHAAGLLHDVGKASVQFQDYLRRCELSGPGPARGPDHKGAGAVLAQRLGMDYLVPIIEGHHGGLSDLKETRSWLRERASDAAVQATLDGLPRDVRDLVTPGDRPALPSERADAEMLLRMGFSALVDADCLDTEAHFSQWKAQARRNPVPGLGELRDRFAANQGALTARSPATEVNAVRREIMQAASAAASEPVGLFRLAVPTGGGKTRAAMGFALEHALLRGLRRVIVAVPFTSITEQTAEVYREIFGSEAVLEHHSGVEEEHAEPGRRLWARLAVENWDAPIVVTTTVQLMESLFGNGTSKTRKLHRIAHSVIVIDEAQALPVRFMKPMVGMLRRLCDLCETTVVLSTATQPSADVGEMSWISEGRDMVPHPARLFDRMRRVEWTSAAESWDGARLAREMAAGAQAMVIVNTRRDAMRQLDQCPGALHLSTLLCGAHRRQVLDAVRRRLASGDRCHLVSTQVVEAGVDVDFPLVLRALAPFDSIVQAGGRCNREGKLSRGRVVVFRGEGGRLPPDYRTGTDLTRAMLAEGPVDFDDPSAAARYFRDLYRNKDLDSEHICDKQLSFAYETVARDFQMIEDTTKPVLVPFDAEAGEARRLFRRLQPYLVGLRPRELERARRAGWTRDGIVPVWTGPYDQVRGVGALVEDEKKEVSHERPSRGGQGLG